MNYIVLESDVSLDELARQLAENMARYDDLIDFIHAIDMHIADSVFTDAVIEKLTEYNEEDE